MNTLFDRILNSDELYACAELIVDSEALRSILERTEELRSLRSSIYSGSITENDLRSVVSSVLFHLQPGEFLDGNVLLAMIAIALEPIQSPFANEYIHDLSSLKLAEMRMCIGVAKVCKARRASTPKNWYKEIVLSSISEDTSIRVTIHMTPSQFSEIEHRKTADHAEVFDYAA